MCTITLNKIVKSYSEGPPVVKDVSLDVHDGEFVILVGPSGCGKSTVLRMIAGLEDITSGELRIDDARANEKKPRDRNLAMVFQNYALYPHLSVFENIAFPLRLSGAHHEADVRRKVGEVAKLLELTELLERKPSQLSGGQRQRVAMGRAIVKPQLVRLHRGSPRRPAPASESKTAIRRVGRLAGPKPLAARWRETLVRAICSHAAPRDRLPGDHPLRHRAARPDRRHQLRRAPGQ